jgi:hypothetical protein
MLVVSEPRDDQLLCLRVQHEIETADVAPVVMPGERAFLNL